jgi:hypothetical protein
MSPTSFAFSLLNCLGHDFEGARHMPSARTSAHTFSSAFFEQIRASVCLQPTVRCSVSSGWSGKWYLFVNGRACMSAFA